jgi:hypothetical protein
MKKMLIAAAVLFSLIGCANDNQLVIRNDADVNIDVTFIATLYQINPHTSQAIANIPNGTYDYGISAIVPVGDTLASTPPDGSILFQKQSTKWLFVVTSTVSGNTYSLLLAKSSSDATSVTSQ